MNVKYIPKIRQIQIRKQHKLISSDKKKCDTKVIKEVV